MIAYSHNYCQEASFYHSIPIEGSFISWAHRPLHRLLKCPHDMAANFPQRGQYKRIREKSQYFLWSSSLWNKTQSHLLYLFVTNESLILLHTKGVVELGSSSWREYFHGICGDMLKPQQRCCSLFSLEVSGLYTLMKYKSL